MPLKIKVLSLYWIIILFGIDLNMAGAQQAGIALKNSPPFTIVLSGPATPTKSGSICEMSIIVNNITSQQIALPRVNGENVAAHDYKIRVTDTKGLLVPSLTSQANSTEKEERPIRSSFRFKRLKPQESFEDKINLNQLYDLHLPGFYKIRVQREIPSEFGGGFVTSNEVTIKVDP